MTAAPNYWGVITSHMVYQAPFLLAYTVLFVFVFLRRRRAPRAAALALAAFALMFMSSFLASAFQGYLIADAISGSPTSTSHIVSAIYAGRTLVELVALGLLVAAVFAGRSTPATDD